MTTICLSRIGSHFCPREWKSFILSSLGASSKPPNGVLWCYPLKNIGNAIGKLHKVDACTNSTLCRKYACLCVQISIDETVLSSIQIGKHKRAILYEGEGFMCTNCGRFGHVHMTCPHKSIDAHKNPPPQDILSHWNYQTNRHKNGKLSSSLQGKKLYWQKK